MDKTWMKISNRKDKAYELGVKNFLKFAYSQKVDTQKIPCPCTQCNNFCNQTKTVVEDHLLTQGIRKSYTRWIHHGEQFRHQNCGDSTKHGDGEEDSDTEDLNDMLHDIGTAQWGDNWAGREESTDDSLNANHSDTNNFLKLLEDAKKELYPGNHFYSKLSFVVTLLHLKTMSGWTIKSFNALLEIFSHALPPEATVPKSFADAKKLIRDLGFKSEKIHACVNDCVLFRKENENFDTCPNLNCKEPRYKMAGSRVPRKVLRYFPLKPRLQRLYTHKEIASDMRWHKEKCVHDDNIMRHPADSEAWKDFDRLHPDFAVDPRNVRLGLATDGFNPFGTMSSAYSIWPIYLVPYNLPPWKCMRDPFFFLSMLIPGPKISERNKQNRAKNDCYTTVGTKSLARVVEEKKRKEDVELSEIDMFELSRKSKKSGGLVNDKAKETLDKMRELQATTSMTSKEICEQELGYVPGHIRGRSATKKQAAEVERWRHEIEDSRKRADEAEKRAAEVTQQFTAQQELIKTLQQQQTETRSLYDELANQLKDLRK
nr:uncharacterized protein LOC113709365 isoform X2 [Coffea arabica]